MEFRGVRYLIIAVALFSSMTYMLYDYHQKNVAYSRNNTELLNQNSILLNRVQDLGGELSRLRQENHGQTEAAAQNANAACASMNINLNSAVFNASGDNKLLLKLENVGTLDALVDKIRVTGKNLNTTTYSNPTDFSGTLNRGDKVVIALVIDTARIDSISGVRVIPADCPQNAITITASEMLFLR